MYCPICDQKPMNCDCTPEERRMHSEIEDLEGRVPRWIPIDESLPDVDDHVLIFCPLLEPEETTCADRQANGMWVCDGGQLLGATEPTHWMPLPPPPDCTEPGEK